jgi:hypothetical protein
MIEPNDILFASVNLPILDKKTASKEILNLNSSYWFWDEYRATNMLPLMTKGAIAGSLGSDNYRPGEFHWLPYTPEIIREWFEHYVFPWMGQKTRIMALVTKPDFKNNEHIDSTLDEVGSRQHKFRIVLQGNTDTLYFKTNKGDISSPKIEEPFIMDGSWPHGMYNYTEEIKVTLAAGAPWNGNESYSNIDVLLKKSDYELPSDISEYLNYPRRWNGSRPSKPA